MKNKALKQVLFLIYFQSILAENNRASSVERLVFYNHTECECRDKMEDLMPRDVPVPPAGTSISNTVNGALLNTATNPNSPIHQSSSRVEKNLNGLQ